MIAPRPCFLPPDSRQKFLPAFLHLLAVACSGDIIVAWRLDHLGCTLKDLVETMQILVQCGIELKSLKENIATITPAGQ